MYIRSMWLMWCLFWTVAVVCRVASEQSGAEGSLILLVLGCAAAAGVGWATAAFAGGRKKWANVIALMLGWSLAYLAGKSTADLVGSLTWSALGFRGGLLDALLALALGGALLGTVSVLVLVQADRLKRGLRLVAGWMIVFPLAVHLSLIVAYLSGSFLEIGQGALLVMGSLLSGILTGYLCSNLLVRALGSDAQRA